ncbi:Gag-Pro-Pol polyprotein [Bienertia sinuspersici]
MRNGIKDFFDIKYKKAPVFCFYCGRVGHGVKVCHEYRKEDDVLQIGPWLKASPWKQVRLDDVREKNNSATKYAKSLFVPKPKCE